MLRAAQLVAHAATTDAYRSIAFYQELLGFAVMTNDEYAVAFNCNGTELRLRKVDKVEPAPYTTVGWQVRNIERTVAQLTTMGIKFERHNFLQQDPLGVWQAPSGTWVAWFRDPDGNLLSVTERGPG